MAFPQVAGTSQGGGSSSGGLSITLPSGVTVGERLVATVAFDTSAADTVTMSSSGATWEKRHERSADGNAIVGVFERIATGSDSLTVSISGNSAAELGSYVVRRITGSDTSQALEVAGASNPTGSPDATLDAPSLTPSWGSADTMWMWAGIWDNSTRTLSSWPTNYSANQVTETGGGTSAAVTVATATRENAASSEDPGTATLSTSDQWAALTIAIKPAGGGADTTPPTITGPGGASGATSSISIPENTTAVHTMAADESVTWSLNGGADAALFEINSSTGALAFSSAPDYESPADADTNNVYVVVVRATDGASNTTDQTVSVTVSDQAAPSIDTQPSSQTVNEGETADFSVAATGADSYQWQVSTNGGSSWSNVASGTGGSTTDYTTEATTAGMDGYQYRCQCANAEATTNTAAADLNVNAAATTMTIALKQSDGSTAAASITGIEYAILNAATLAAATAVLDTGSGESTDGSGNLVLDVTGLGLFADDVRYVVAGKSDGTVGGNFDGWHGPAVAA